MKPFNYYRTYSPQPTKEEHTDVFVYSKGETVWRGKFSDYRPLAESRFKGMLVEKIVNEDGFKAARIARDEQRCLLQIELKTDLLNEFGITGHPKAEHCYATAWELAGNDSLEHLYNVLEILVDLIKD